MGLKTAQNRTDNLSRRSYFSPEAQAFYLLMEAAAEDYAKK